MRSLALLLCLLCSVVLAAPPSIEIPPEVKATSEYVTISPKTDASAITYVAQSGVEPFPSAFLKDPRSFVLPTRGLAAGRYKFVAIGSLKDEHQRVDFVVVIGDAPPTPPVPPGPGPQPPGPNPPVPTDPNVKATAVTYVYEKDATAIPPQVLSGLNRLNREKKILATLFEDDTTNGGSSVPEQYKLAHAAAKEQGLPALVVTDGKTVLKVVKDPKTEQAVMEAVQ